MNKVRRLDRGTIRWESGQEGGESCLHELFVSKLTC